MSDSLSSLYGKKILLGITASIAAYKSHEIVRLLVAKGAIVKVVLTENAKSFVTPLSLQALANDKVYANNMLTHENEAAMEHIELARWADIILIAPCSANFIARLRIGLADDLLTTLCLATKSKIAISPAMNEQMWLNSATTENLNVLRDRGFFIIGPGVGSQACGEFGPGRMLEPLYIAAEISKIYSDDTSIRDMNFCIENHNLPLKNKKILITAGPTQEPIDPVRYISNRSSGKMGYALAKVASELGADVILISGPTNLSISNKVKLINVVTAMEMYEATMKEAVDVDIFIATAAVSDYRSVSVALQKIKKSCENLTIELTKNPDILYSVANLEKKPFIVGFAAETNNVLENAKQKLINKNLDMIIANCVAEGKVFGRDETTALVIDKNNNIFEYNNVSKYFLATEILNKINIK